MMATMGSAKARRLTAQRETARAIGRGASAPAPSGGAGDVGDPGGAGEGDGRPVLRIDCAECVLEGTSACVDCVVTFLVGREAGTPVIVDAAEVRALGALARGGLAPVLRHQPRQPA
jgi:hypothetical protein